MSNLLQDGNLSLRLDLGIYCDLAQPSFLGKALYDLDRDVVSGVETPCQFDLAMDSSPNLLDDFVLVYELPAGDKVLFDLSLVGSGVQLSVSIMSP